MSQFLVYVEAEKKGKWMLPKREYRAETGNAGTAARIAFQNFRKDNPKTRFGIVNIKVIPA